MHIGVAASDFGVYRFRGGWITRGNLYLGRHAVPTEIAKVISSDVDVLTAELVPDPADPERRLVKLISLRPGIARLTFQAWKLDGKRQRIDGPMDSFARAACATTRDALSAP